MDMTTGCIALPENERSTILDQRILAMTAQGDRLEIRTATQAVLRAGKPVNHVLHLLLTLFCCTLWIPVWLFVTLSGGERTILVTVDPYGNDRSDKQDLSSGTKTTLAIIAVLWIVTVNLVDLGSVNGVRMKYKEGREGASAKISKADRACVIKGTAQGFEGDHLVDPPVTADFGITVACP